MLTALLLSLSLSQAPSIASTERHVRLLEKEVTRLELRLERLEQPLPTERVLISGIGLGVLSTGLGFLSLTVAGGWSPLLSVLGVVLLVSGPIAIVGAIAVGIVFAVRNARPHPELTEPVRAELAQKRLELQQARTPITVFAF